MIYDRAGATRDPLKPDLAPEAISILPETHINHEQIHHTINN